MSGINGGKLMCETRREFRQTRVNYGKSSDSMQDVVQNVLADVVDGVKPPRSARPPRTEGAPRARGSGPRDGSEWTLVKEGRVKKSSQDNSDAPLSITPRVRGRPPRSAAPKQDS